MSTIMDTYNIFFNVGLTLCNHRSVSWSTSPRDTAVVARGIKTLWNGDHDRGRYWGYKAIDARSQPIGPNVIAMHCVLEKLA